MKPIIKVNNVIKSFPVGNTEVTILRGVSLTVQPGEFGEIFVTEAPLHTMSENAMAMWRGVHLGIIFQFFQMLPSLTLLQNIILPMEFAGKYTRRERQERAMGLLELVGLADQARKLPSMVSGGQQQRAAIARALANDPPIIVGDEPTGNLDAKTANEVFDIFHGLVAKGKTMLMVTHDRELAARMPRMVEVVNGLIHHDTGQDQRT
jgi:putative ABC transport system ATP-binding protein